LQVLLRLSRLLFFIAKELLFSSNVEQFLLCKRFDSKNVTFEKRGVSHVREVGGANSHRVFEVLTEEDVCGCHEDELPLIRHLFTVVVVRDDEGMSRL